MPFILILMVGSISSTNLGITSIRFESELACETAYMIAQREFKRPLEHVCVPVDKR